MQQLGRYPAAGRVIAHVSDTHVLTGDALLGDAVDTAGNAAELAEQLGDLGAELDAIVVTGDIADVGEPGAYRRVRELLEPVAVDAGAELIWVMGNHDERTAFRSVLLGEQRSMNAPVDAPVHHRRWVGGLRVLALDSTVAGYHHGAIDDSARAWLESELETPAPEGTVLAMHHAPIATPVSIMDVLELRGQDELEAIIAASDIRLILGGHLHYATQSTFAGVPVAVAGAVSYTIDASAPHDELIGIDAGQSYSLVHLFDHHVTTSLVPLRPQREVTRFSADFVHSVASLPADERLERFSRKPTPGDRDG